MFGFELAYIDPGSGSLIIQGAIASIVAAAVFFRGQIARLMPSRGERHESGRASTTASSTSASSVEAGAQDG